VKCELAECTGTVVDGYCDVCGMAPRRRDAPTTASGVAVVDATQAYVSGATTVRRAATRRTGASSARSRLGAGLVEITPAPFRDPESSVLADPAVAEARRFCGQCGEPVGRSRERAPGRHEGFCRNCGARFSFTPRLTAGDVVAGQYEVVGCLAHGGMGWVYLAKDRNVSDRWVVLKGLLNTGDDDAMTAALAERRFLAEVEHPNIVKIFNFVQHDSSGYIVMEYVGGTSLKTILTDRRAANGGRPDPLPVAQAIAYMLEILPALGYLHRTGLLFCDFKLDNVIQTQSSLKLIDLGGVYRMGDLSSPIYGTVGYQAPEIAQEGPTVASDLYTVARTLAVLCFEFSGYQGPFRFTLPRPETVEVFQRFDSLYRFLLKGTAREPDDRFESAEEMADQLFGVMREVVAAENGTTVPAQSSRFTGELRGRTDGPHWHALPALRVAADDPAAGFLATLQATDPADEVVALRAAPDRTVEVELRLARALLDAGDPAGALERCAEIETEDPWEWRAQWMRGIVLLAQERPAAAVSCFDAVYRAVPGELAPRLALGVAAESARQRDIAARWYEIVARTDPAFTSAFFGLARSRAACGDRPGALAAYAAVPASSSGHTDAQIARITLMLAGDPQPADLREAGAALDALTLDAESRSRLAVRILEAALRHVTSGRTPPDPGETLLGIPLAEDQLRLGLERTYRMLGHRADDRDERIRLVDAANSVRPKTWT
jgi:serine/threonine-protein kinase PknG